MKTQAIENVQTVMTRLDWEALDAKAQKHVLERPTMEGSVERSDTVASIIEQVRKHGDKALHALTKRLDHCELDQLCVTQTEYSSTALPVELKRAITRAAERIELFHQQGMQQPVRVETAPGVVCERIPRPLERVGLYVPAGSAPLPSTVLMLSIPAKLAGCGEVVLCTPPRADGQVDEAVLYAASMYGVDKVFKLGGAQAIAAMALGTESVPACDKLFGPGNSWVTEAKHQVSQLAHGPAIDMPAGPSEILIIADATANPAFVAADLLSQAEHGPDSQVLLLTDSDDLLDKVAQEVAVQLVELPRRTIARQALSHSHMIKVASLAKAVELSNRYAPEHLIINTRYPRQLLVDVLHAGSVFLGAWAPESMGDYCSGTNHVLPTYGYARTLSGLSVDSFRKQLTVQTLTTEGLGHIGSDARVLARAEGLEAHARAVDVRLQALEQAP